MAVRYTRAEAIAMGIAIATKRKARSVPQPESIGEATLAQHLKAHKLPMGEAGYAFDEARKWAFDRAWPDLRIAAEVEGGTRSNGRHVRHYGYENDCEKYNAATLAGWRVYRFTTEQVRSGYAVETLREALCR